MVKNVYNIMERRERMGALGRRLVTARERKGLTQSALAKESGIPQATISRIEAGKIARPSAEYVRKLCAALHVDPSYLISDEPKTWTNGPGTPQWKVEECEDVCKKLEGVFEVSRHGMSIVKLDGTHCCTNDVLTEMMGYGPGELSGLSIHDTTHPEDLHLSADFMRDALDGKITTGQIRKRHFRRDGRVVHTLVTSSIIRSTEGIPVCFVSRVEEERGPEYEDSILGNAMGGE